MSCFRHELLASGTFVAENKERAGYFDGQADYRRKMPKNIGLNPASIVIEPAVTLAIIEHYVAQAEEKG